MALLWHCTSSLRLPVELLLLLLLLLLLVVVAAVVVAVVEVASRVIPLVLEDRFMFKKDRICVLMMMAMIDIVAVAAVGTT